MRCMHRLYNRKRILILAIVLFAIFFCIFYVGRYVSMFTATTEKTRLYKLIDDLSACLKHKDFEQCQSKSIQKYAADISFDSLAAHLRIVSHESEELNKACHSFWHSAGTILFERSKDIHSALRDCPPDCKYGCHHFVAVGYLGNKGKHISPRQLAPVMRAACEAVDSKSRLHCYHGLGHALAIAIDYDIPRSLSMCDVVYDPLLKRACVQGVFMQAVTMSEGQIIFDPAKPYALCDGYPREHQIECSGYLVRQWVPWYGIQKSRDLCKPYGEVCFSGLAYWIYSHHTTQGSAMQCERMQPDTDQCIHHMLSISLKERGSDTEALQICGYLQGEREQIACKANLKQIKTYTPQLQN